MKMLSLDQVISGLEDLLADVLANDDPSSRKRWILSDALEYLHNLKGLQE